MKRLMILFLMLMFCSPVLHAGGRRDQLPAPRIISPGDETDLTGQSELEFRWSSEGDRTGLDHYDFRLYKGHETLENGLIKQQNIPAGQASIKLSADIFENGQVYAWSIRQVGVRKGRSNYVVSKVKKGS